MTTFISKNIRLNSVFLILEISISFVRYFQHFNKKKLSIFQANSNSPKSRSTPLSTAAAADTRSNETKSYSSDLLGLSTPMNGPVVTESKPVVDNSNDIFGCFMDNTTINGKSTTAVPSTNNTTKETTAAAAVEPTLAQQEHDFFNQVPNEKEKAKMTKDSILALYGAAPSMSAMPTNNQFMQGIPPMNATDNGSLFGMPSMQFPQQPAFGMPAANTPAANTSATGGLNNFAQFGMMQTGQQMNFQQSNTMNSMPNQSMGFSNVPPANPTLQPFNQANANKTNSFPTANHTPNVNQQFGNLNLGNVWQ